MDVKIPVTMEHFEERFTESPHSKDISGYHIKNAEITHKNLLSNKHVTNFYDFCHLQLQN